MALANGVCTTTRAGANRARFPRPGQPVTRESGRHGLRKQNSEVFSNLGVLDSLAEQRQVQVLRRVDQVELDVLETVGILEPAGVQQGGSPVTYSSSIE